ncbi:TPA: hypothetical protein QDZ10_002151 [Stenotrophomonas maltophilia]|nr:hypothetical protein [Stenotrophomonas maltophilia]
MKQGMFASTAIVILSMAAASEAFAECQSETRELEGSPATAEVCIVSAGMFKPNSVTASVNGEAVFSGTDREDVVFDGRYQGKMVSGGCNEIVTILDMATMKGAPIAGLPDTLVSECRITPDAEGHALPFEKDAACSKTFYTALGPLLGKLMPAADAKRCTVLLDGVEVLSREFKL